MKWKLFLLTASVLVAAAAVISPQQLDERYVVRIIDGTVTLIDLETGWTWRRVSTNPDKPPRWQHTDRFRNGEAAQDWLDTQEAAPAKPGPGQARITQWASEILLGPEYQGRNSDALLIRRWVSSPTLSVFGGTEQQQQAVTNAVEQINQALAGSTSVRIRQTDDENEKAAIGVHFLPADDFDEFCRKRNLEHSGRDMATFWAFWDNKSRITRATVLISSDLTRANEMRHLVLEEITQSLGPMNDSALFPKSTFFSGVSFHAELSPEDRQLLAILYRRLRAGDSPARLRRAISRYWRSAAPAEK